MRVKPKPKLFAAAHRSLTTKSHDCAKLAAADAYATYVTKIKAFLINAGVYMQLCSLKIFDDRSLTHLCLIVVKIKTY